MSTAPKPVPVYPTLTLVIEFIDPTMSFKDIADAVTALTDEAREQGRIKSGTLVGLPTALNVTNW